MAVADVLPFTPRPGQYLPRIGGRHAGVLGDYSLVMGQFAPTELNWSDAAAWVHSLRVGPHDDFQLPSIIELELMIRVLPTLFAVPRLWSCDQVAEVPADAWAFDFATDSATGWGKHFGNYAIAVRREVRT